MIIGAGIRSGKTALNEADKLIQNMLGYVGIHVRSLSLLNITELQKQLEAHNCQIIHSDDGNRSRYTLSQDGKDILLGELWHETNYDPINMTSRFMSKLTPIT